MNRKSVAAAALSVAAAAALIAPSVATAAPTAPSGSSSTGASSAAGSANALFDAKGTPKALAGQMVLGPNNLPDGLNFNGSILSGAGPGWDRVWAGLNAVKVAPPACKALYAGFPIPPKTDTAQTNATGDGITYSIVVSKFSADLAAMKAAVAGCSKFTVTGGPVITQVVAKPVPVPGGGSDSVGVEFDVFSRRGNITQYTISRSYTTVVDGVTIALRGSRATREQISFTPADGAAEAAAITTQIAVIKNPPQPIILPPKPAPKAKPGAKPGAKPAASAKPAGKPGPAAATTPVPAPR